MTEPMSGDPELSRTHDALAASQERATFFDAKLPADEAELATIYASASRRLMGPLRSVTGAMRRFARGSRAWIRLHPGSRPSRKIRNALLGTLKFILARPNLTRIARQPLERFPLLKRFQRRAFNVLLADVGPAPGSFFSEREQFVHARLAAALERRAS